MGCRACAIGVGVHMCQRYAGDAVVQRPHLTFAEAMEAALNGAKVRLADWDTDVYWRYSGARIVHGVSGEPPSIGELHLKGQWHIIEDKPAKSRIREMAEAEANRVPGLAMEAYERVARQIVEAVVQRFRDGNEESTANYIKTCFLEPRK